MWIDVDAIVHGFLVGCLLHPTPSRDLVKVFNIFYMWESVFNIFYMCDSFLIFFIYGIRFYIWDLFL